MDSRGVPERLLICLLQRFLDQIMQAACCLHTAISYYENEKGRPRRGEFLQRGLCGGCAFGPCPRPICRLVPVDFGIVPRISLEYLSGNFPTKIWRKSSGKIRENSGGSKIKISKRSVLPETGRHSPARGWYCMKISGTCAYNSPPPPKNRNPSGRCAFTFREVVSQMHENRQQHVSANSKVGPEVFS